MKFDCLNQKRVSDSAFRTLLVVFILLTPNAIVFAQNDSFTPLSLKPGSPDGSYALTDIDTVNLFSGRVNVSIPLIKRAGRGDVKAQTAFTKDSPTRWQIYKSVDLNENLIYAPGLAGISNFEWQYNTQGEFTVYPIGVGTGAANWCSEGLYAWGGGYLNTLLLG